MGQEGPGGFRGPRARWLEPGSRTGWHHALCPPRLSHARVSVSTAKQVCPAEKLSCGPTSHKCVPASWRCDGEKDCESGVDEAGCATCESGVRSPGFAKHSQAGSGSSGRSWGGARFSRGLGRWRGKGNGQDTSNGRALCRDILFHPHKHLTNSHYHPHLWVRKLRLRQARKSAHG